MPKNQRRSNQGGGAERHGRAMTGKRTPRGQAGYNTSVVHREMRSQDGKDHHGAGKRRAGKQVGERRPGRHPDERRAPTARKVARVAAAPQKKRTDTTRKMKGAGPGARRKGATAQATGTNRR